jgi:quercetin dioxygenase-like cupin family protein
MSADAGSYFALNPHLRATSAGRYLDLDGLSPVEFVEGLEFRPVIGERMMVNFVHYRPNTEAPTHAHEEEQVTFVIDGEFEFDLDGDVRTMRRGMAVHVPPGVPHGARTLDSTCFEVDVFAPPRRVLLDAVRQAAAAAASDSG